MSASSRVDVLAPPPRPRTSLPLLLLVLALGPGFPGCRGAPPEGDPSLVLEVGISPTPPAVGPARLIILVRDTLGLPVEGAEIRVEGNMSHAGMAPVLGSAEVQGPGDYVVPDFRFTMAGDWVLTVTASLPDGREARIQVETGVVGAPPGFPGRDGGPGSGSEGLRDTVPGPGPEGTGGGPP